MDKKNIHIGIDVGNSTTKIMGFIEGKEKPFPLVDNDSVGNEWIPTEIAAIKNESACTICYGRGIDNTKTKPTAQNSIKRYRGLKNIARCTGVASDTMLNSEKLGVYKAADEMGELSIQSAFEGFLRHVFSEAKNKLKDSIVQSVSFCYPNIQENSDNYLYFTIVKTAIEKILKDEGADWEFEVSNDLKVQYYSEGTMAAYYEIKNDEKKTYLVVDIGYGTTDFYYSEQTNKGVIEPENVQTSIEFGAFNIDTCILATSNPTSEVTLFQLTTLKKYLFAEEEENYNGLRNIIKNGSSLVNDYNTAKDNYNKLMNCEDTPQLNKIKEYIDLLKEKRLAKIIWCGGMTASEGFREKLKRIYKDDDEVEYCWIKENATLTSWEPGPLDCIAKNVLNCATSVIRGKGGVEEKKLENTSPVRIYCQYVDPVKGEYLCLITTTEKGEHYWLSDKQPYYFWNKKKPDGICKNVKDTVYYSSDSSIFKKIGTKGLYKKKNQNDYKKCYGDLEKTTFDSSEFTTKYYTKITRGIVYENSVNCDNLEIKDLCGFISGEKGKEKLYGKAEYKDFTSNNSTEKSLTAECSASPSVPCKSNKLKNAISNLTKYEYGLLPVILLVLFTIVTYITSLCATVGGLGSLAIGFGWAAFIISAIILVYLLFISCGEVNLVFIIVVFAILLTFSITHWIYMDIAIKLNN